MLCRCFGRRPGPKDDKNDENRMTKQNAFYAQSGGVTAVINTTACGIIETARKNRDKIGKVYAGRNGIIGALLDCHCNWTACWYLMNERGLDKPPCTVTAEYSIRLLRPTPSDGPVGLRAWVHESAGDKVVVHGELSAGGKVCDTCVGTFIAVQPGHPAYRRW